MINATIHRVYHGKRAIYSRNNNKENQRHNVAENATKHSAEVMKRSNEWHRIAIYVQ